MFGDNTDVLMTRRYGFSLALLMAFSCVHTSPCFPQTLHAAVTARSGILHAKVQHFRGVDTGLLFFGAENRYLCRNTNSCDSS